MRDKAPAYPMTVYLCGLMSGEKLKETVSWRQTVREYYENWKGQGQYEIDFIDPFNGPELDSIDKEGLKSSVPAKAIIAGDFMSVKKCDLIVANLNDFGSSRPLIGSHWELAWCWMMQKPFIIIVSKELRHRYETHPFTGQATFVFESVEEFLASKSLNYFYKRLNPATYHVEF